MTQLVTESPPVHHQPQPLGLVTAALALLISALWGGTAVAVSYSVDTLPPIAVAACRFALGAVFLVLWCRIEGTTLQLRPGQGRVVLITGVLLFVQISLFNIGVHRSNSSHGTLLINSYVLWVAALEHFVTRGDRMSSSKVTGLLLAAAGAVLILAVTGAEPREATATGRDAPSFGGDLILALSALILAVKVLYTKRAVRSIEPGKLVFWHSVVGVALFVLYSACFEQVSWGGFTLVPVLGLLYQGVLVAGLCFAIHATLLRRHSASQISVFSFASPLFGILFAVLLRGDPMSPWLLLSGALVAAGILLVNLR